MKKATRVMTVDYKEIMCVCVLEEGGTRQTDRRMMTRQTGNDDKEKEKGERDGKRAFSWMPILPFLYPSIILDRFKDARERCSLVVVACLLRRVIVRVVEMHSPKKQKPFKFVRSVLSQRKTCSHKKFILACKMSFASHYNLQRVRSNIFSN